MAEKKTHVTANVSGYYRVYVDDEVDIPVDSIDDKELVAALEAKGYRCIPPPTQAIPAEPEYRLWEALHFGRDDELKRVAAEMVYDRIGRIV